MPDTTDPAALIFGSNGGRFHMSSLPIRRFQFFTIRTRDLGRARQFYVDWLGFPVTSEKSGEYVQVEIGGVPICVDVTAEDSPQQPNQIGVEVDDLPRTIELLSRRGIPVTQGSGTAEHWASVRDPDGHEIIFIAAS